MNRYTVFSGSKNNTTTGRILVVVVIILVAVLAAYLHDKPPVIPTAIQKQVNFVIFYPQPNNQITLEKSTIKYDKSIAQISYIVNFANQHITFSEQASPDSFAADPTFYSNFVQKLNGYATFDSLNGTVNLTLPTEIKTETGVMNAKGTLVFVKSSGNLSENNWKLLFNSLSYTQPR
jgi:hypothetical protein